MRISRRRLGPDELDHELLWLAVSVGSLACAGLWLATGLLWPRCPFHAVTSLPCLTCGTTRSMIAFLHGDFPAALKWNPLAFVAWCALIVFDFYALIVVVGRLARVRIDGWTTVEKNAARIAAVSLLALNWIYLLAHHARY